MPLALKPGERSGQRPEDAGLVITGLHWLLVKPEGLHLVHPDERVRRKTIDYLLDLIDLCADLGGSVLTFGSPNQRSIPAGTSRESGWRLAVEGLSACAAHAEARGVTLCLEALPGTLTNLLNTNEEVLAMVREIARPGIGMMLDVKSMCAEAAIIDNIRSCSGSFQHVHANDANLRGPGFGDVDFRPILATLAELAYSGYVSVEVFDFSPDPETVARESILYLRACLGRETP